MRKGVRLEKNMLWQCAAMPQNFVSGYGPGLRFEHRAVVNVFKHFLLSNLILNELNVFYL